MNIIEAIKSGKKFRRKGWSYFLDIEEFESFFYRSDDILADDWEVEEKTVTITESQFDDIVNRIYDINSDNWATKFQFTQAIKKELGL